MSRSLKITGLAYGGAGIGRVEGKVVFVPYTAPGDEAEVEITLEKKRFSRGVLESVLTPSAERTEPVCPVYGRCGGCNYQHIGYEAQVRLKQGIFADTLKRISKVDTIEFDPPVPCSKPYAYRSRARLHVASGLWGFFKASTNEVVDITECPILDPLINDTFGGIRSVLTGAQALYSVEIGLSSRDSRTVATLYLEKEEALDIEGLLAGVEALKGLELRIKGRGGARLIASYGDTRLLYDSGGIKFSSTPGVFTQVNYGQNEQLIKKVIEYAALAGGSSAVDLFSGIGNLTLPLAGAGGRILGVESALEAVKSARDNARVNSLESVKFVREEAGGWLGGGEGAGGVETGGFDVVVLDPPRGGDPGVAKALKRVRPKRIVYVSCDPPTMARDINLLAGCGYKRFRAAFIDMFPQTYHIEGVVVIEP
jgi:23S rRNA (uracil1939-C5)-methyltransferase